MQSNQEISASKQAAGKVSLVNIVSALFLFLIIVLNVFCAEKGSFFHKRVFLLPNWALLLIGLVFVALYFALCRALQGTKFGKSAADISARPMTIRIILLVVFVLQLAACYGAYFETGWDVKMLLDNARIYAGSGTLASADYFSWYPNNLFLLKIYASMFKLFGGAAGIYVILLINALSNSLSGLCLFRVLRKLFDVKRAWLGFVFWLVLVGTSPWLLVPYSDSVALFIPVLIFDLWLQAREASFGKRMFLYVAVALLAALSYRIKPQAFIVVIALILLQIKSLFKPGKVSEKALFVSVPCIVLAVFLALTGMWAKSSLNLTKESHFSMAHFLMMGANYDTNGTYSEEDVNYSSSYATVKERSRADLLLTQERYADMSLNVFNHLKNKLLVNFHDGTFAWEKEGNFYTTIYPGKLPVISNVAASVSYGGGEAQKASECIRQCFWLTLLIMAVLSGLTCRNKELSTIFLTILGLIVFLLLFEARARYLYSNVPLFIVVALSFQLPKKNK
ncbi:MAG: hypothetical protein IKR39_12760 [Lachnospiraceae bacterium]|nr:hypothetical protein [Lachnospiraceae bacterium]